jgi:hypothetical protein
LKHDNGWVTNHSVKENVVHSQFRAAMQTGDVHSLDLSWDALHFEEPNVASMGEPFTEEEVRNAINQMPSDKVPGPDGFTGIFFQEVLGHYQGGCYEGD